MLGILYCFSFFCLFLTSIGNLHFMILFLNEKNTTKSCSLHLSDSSKFSINNQFFYANKTWQYFNDPFNNSKYENGIV